MKKLAFILLGLAAAAFGDHIVSYYLVQWSPALTRYPTLEEQAAVMQARTLDITMHASMWAAFIGSFLAWRSGVLRREPRHAAAQWLPIAAGGAAMYAIGRVLIEAPLMVETVRVPATAFEWQGPGRLLVALALLLSAALLVQPRPLRRNVRR